MKELSSVYSTESTKPSQFVIEFKNVVDSPSLSPSVLELCEKLSDEIIFPVEPKLSIA